MTEKDFEEMAMQYVGYGFCEPETEDLDTPTELGDAIVKWVAIGMLRVYERAKAEGVQ